MEVKKITKEEYEAIKKISGILTDEDKKIVEVYELENDIKKPDSILSDNNNIIDTVTPSTSVNAEILEQKTEVLSKKIEEKTEKAKYQKNKALKDLDSTQSDNEEEKNSKSNLKPLIVLLSSIGAIALCYRYFNSKPNSSTLEANRTESTENRTEETKQNKEQNTEQNFFNSVGA